MKNINTILMYGERFYCNVVVDSYLLSLSLFRSFKVIISATLFTIFIIY